MGAECLALIVYAIRCERDLRQGRVERQRAAVSAFVAPREPRRHAQVAQCGVVAEAPLRLVASLIRRHAVHVVGGEPGRLGGVATGEGVAYLLQGNGRLLVDVPVVGGTLLRARSAVPERYLVERETLGADATEDRRPDAAVADGQGAAFPLGVGRPVGAILARFGCGLVETHVQGALRLCA